MAKKTEVETPELPKRIVKIGAGIYPRGTDSTKYKYSSSDSEIAYIHGDGMVSGVSVGVCTVTATNEAGSESWEITVEAAPTL